MSMNKTYDLVSLGRSSIDLYANEIGVPFTEIKSFAAYVGGCPTNISVAACRLGLKTALLTPVGDDFVADFVLNFLAKEGVDTKFAVRKPGFRTSAFLLGIEPPEKFSLVPYRDNCADLELTNEDVLASPVADSRAILITGSGLSRQPSREATMTAVEQCRSKEGKVILDLDFRPEMWGGPQRFSAELSPILHRVDVIIGTEFELQMATGNDQSSPAQTVTAFTDNIMALGPEALIIKRSAESTVVYTRDGNRSEVPTFPVEVLNVLGAGDAFAGGLLYGYLKGWDWYRAVRMGNACGAILVTRHGCANFMPHENEVFTFIEEHGGF
jgi:5-dehydro-2-deoxygluconokinase